MFLVTGGAGFIGSHLVGRLIERGESVCVFDDFSTGTIDNLDTVRDRIDLIAGDVRDEGSVRRAVDGACVIFHQAAISSVQRAIEDSRTTLEVNVVGTLNVLVAAREAGCRRVVFASSAAVYGDAPGLPRSETMTPRPLSTYAVSKLAGEHLCSVFARTSGLETVALRYFNVFGPRQAPGSPYSGVIARFLDALRMGAPPIVYGDGEQSRDFVAVDDVVEANLRAASAPAVAGRVFNIGSGQAVTVNALLATMAEVMGVEIAAVHKPSRPGEIRYSLADITAARQALGFEVSVPLEIGLAQTMTN
ncbi:MAG: SDR family oxidoreductase [Thermomicrobiales bacterium]